MYKFVAGFFKIFLVIFFVMPMFKITRQFLVDDPIKYIAAAGLILIAIDTFENHDLNSRE